MVKQKVGFYQPYFIALVKWKSVFDERMNIALHRSELV